MDDVRSIRGGASINAEIDLPPSKSYTNRALIAASLADGETLLSNISRGDDTNLLIQALQQFGVKILETPAGLRIQGSGGVLRAPHQKVYLGNAGTAMRFLTSFAALAAGPTVLTGNERMQERPIEGLLQALRGAGVRCTSSGGFPPVTIHGGALSGKRIDIDASLSSQFLSSLLLSAPYARNPMSIHTRGRLTSLPYVDMTIHIMRMFGAEVQTFPPHDYHVGNRQRYVACDCTIENDATSAGYFFAAAAITGGRVVVRNLPPDSLQGDLRLLGILSEMGCSIEREEGCLGIRGGKLFGTEVEMIDMPDCIPTLAVVAAFAEGITVIHGVMNLQHKESNRIVSLERELRKLGTGIEIQEDALVIHPGPMKSATIETYDDHRIAMSFALAGLRVDGVGIRNSGCVSKSFPSFWDEFRKLER